MTFIIGTRSEDLRCFSYGELSNNYGGTKMCRTSQQVRELVSHPFATRPARILFTSYVVQAGDRGGSMASFHPSLSLRPSFSLPSAPPPTTQIRRRVLGSIRCQDPPAPSDIGQRSWGEGVISKLRRPNPPFQYFHH